MRHCKKIRLTSNSQVMNILTMRSVPRSFFFKKVRKEQAGKKINLVILEIQMEKFFLPFYTNCLKITHKLSNCGKLP